MSLLPAILIDAAQSLVEMARAHNRLLATCESCTGGLVAAAITSVSGSSAVMERGFVTYANQAKQDMLGVPEDMLIAHGAVSEPVARAMAEGALAKVPGLYTAVSITGIAGPGGGSPEKPVGLVYFAVAARQQPTRIHREIYAGDRDDIRLAATLQALAMLRQAVEAG